MPLKLITKVFDYSLWQEPGWKLGLFRSMFCIFCILQLDDYVDVASKLYYPLPLIDLFGIPPLNTNELSLVRTALVASLLSAALGLFTRASLSLSTILFFVYQGVLLSYSRSPHSTYVSHATNIHFFTLFVLSVAPGVENFSLRDRFSFSNQAPRWPRDLIIATLGLVYFGSAYCKWVESGYQWMNGYNLQAILLKKYLLNDFERTLFLANQFSLVWALNIFTLIFETLFIFGVFVPRWRWLFIVGGLSFHLGAFLFLQIYYLSTFCIVYLVFLPDLLPTFHRMTSPLEEPVKKA